MPWRIRLVIYGTAVSGTFSGLVAVQIFQIIARLADQHLRQSAFCRNNQTQGTPRHPDLQLVGGLQALLIKAQWRHYTGKRGYRQKP